MIGGKARLGRRGLCLILVGIIYMLLGFAMINTQQLPGPSAQVLSLAIAVFPLVTWGWIWVAVSCVSLVTAFWPPGKDAWGFGALTGLGALWGCVYLSGALVYDQSRGWTGAGFFAVIVTLLQIISGWPEIPSQTEAVTETNHV